MKADNKTEVDMKSSLSQRTPGEARGICDPLPITLGSADRMS